MSRSSESFPIGRSIALVFAVFILIATLWMSGSIFENLDANQIMVIQAPASGSKRG